MSSVQLKTQDPDSLRVSARAWLQECGQKTLRDACEHWQERYDEAVARRLGKTS